MLTINGTATTLDQLESGTTAASVVTSGVNAGNLVVTLDERATGVSDLLADATADTIVIGADFNTGVNELASKAITVQASSSDLVIDKIIFDEGAETFEIIPVSGQFSGSPAYDFAAMTLSDGTTTLTFDSFLESGQSGGVQVNSGKLVFNINPSSVASLKTMLTTGDPDGVSITSSFSSGQNLVPGGCNNETNSS